MQYTRFIKEYKKVIQKNYTLVLPKINNFHSMVCGYKNIKLSDDYFLFENIDLIDYQIYEKELWKTDKN